MSEIRVVNCGMVNVFLLNDCVLVDTGTKMNYKTIIKYLEKNSIEPCEIKLIILTHAHSDHMGSYKSMLEKTGAKLLIHELEYKQILGEVSEDIYWTKNSSKPNKPLKAHKDILEIDKSFHADVITSEDYDLGEYGIQGKVVHTPGHTKGSVSVVLESGEALIGDNLMAFVPFLPPKKPFIAYDLNEVKKSMQGLIDSGSESFYLSHGKIYPASVIQQAISDF